MVLESAAGCVLLVTAAALLLAWLGRRRLPASVSAALFVAGSTGALVTAPFVTRDSPARPLDFAVVLMALAIFWHVVGRWVGGGSRPGRAQASERPSLHVDDQAPLARGTTARQMVCSQATTLCALAAAGILLGFPGQYLWPAQLILTLYWLPLGLLALRAWLAARTPLSAYAALAVLGRAGYGWIPDTFIRPRAAILSVVLTLAGVAALLAGLLPVWQHWRYRRRVWQTEPERLLDPPRPARLLLTRVLALAVLVGVGGLAVPERVLTPVAVALAAIAAFIAAHRRPGGGLTGEIGLALTGESVILGAVACLPASGFNSLLGCALAAGYLLWLARFWQQQLHQGIAWTTAGRLIPLARRLAYAAAFACGALAVTSAARSASGGLPPTWSSCVTCFVLLGLASMLVRDASKDGSPSAALAACVTVLAALTPAHAALERLGLSAPWPAFFGAAALLLALRVGPQRGRQPPETQDQQRSNVVYDACLAGWIPVVLLCAATVDVGYWVGWGGAAFSGASVLLAVALRWRPAARQPR